MMAKTNRAGEEFEIKLMFAEPLRKGEFPMVYLSGPRDSASPNVISTKQTIKPASWDQFAFRLAGKIPKDAAPGVYEVDRIEVFYSITGMTDAKKRRTITRDEIMPFVNTIGPVEVFASPTLFHIG